MNPETITTFLTGYIHGLREETRAEMSGQKYGFDHIILKLAEADDLIPVRLAFHRGGRSDSPKPKKEPEYGEDLKVISRDGTQLTIFILKDEKLTYKSWQSAEFDKDLRYAVQQDLTRPEFSVVTDVRIVVAYNKDDDARGVEAYEKAIKSCPTKIGDSVKLHFERWNLTTLTELVKAKLIGSPALMPEKTFRVFSYLCWQVQDFSHGTEQWCEVLIPSWKKFLDELLGDNAREKEIRLISVALIILHGHGKNEPAWETGWIEILEWAMIALWRAAQRSGEENLQELVHSIWMSLYIAELQLFYSMNEELLLTEDSLSCGHHGELTQAVASHHAYWHLARLGILAVSYLQVANFCEDDEVAKKFSKAFARHLDTVIGMIKANVACLRPMLDIHHVQLFLIWLIFRAAGREDLTIQLFAEIHTRLVMRRRGGNGVRLLDSGNSWPELLEHIATKQIPDESFGKSSYLLQMLVEICASSLGEEGEAIAWAYYNHLILGCFDGGESMNFPERVELQSWVPPSNWLEKIFIGPVTDAEICVTINYGGTSHLTSTTFPLAVRQFMNTIRAAHPTDLITGVPFGAVILACVVHESPLPPEFWREQIFNTGSSGSVC